MPKPPPLPATVTGFTGIPQALLEKLGINSALSQAWFSQFPATQPWPGSAGFTAPPPPVYGGPGQPKDALEAATLLANGIAPDYVSFTPVDILQWGLSPAEYYRMLEKLGYKQIAPGVFQAIGPNQGSNDFVAATTPGAGGGGGGGGGGGYPSRGGGGGGSRSSARKEPERNGFMYVGEGQQPAQYNTWQNNQQAGYSSGLTRWRI